MKTILKIWKINISMPEIILWLTGMITLALGFLTPITNVGFALGMIWGAVVIQICEWTDRFCLDE